MVRAKPSTSNICICKSRKPLRGELRNNKRMVTREERKSFSKREIGYGLPPSYNISNSFNVCDLSPFDIGFKNSWSNSLQEKEDDEGVTNNNTSIEAPSRRITRSMSRGESSIPSPLSLFSITLV